MHADMTAVTIQSNKIVLNEVKNKSALLEPSYGEKMNFLANLILCTKCNAMHWDMKTYYLNISLPGNQTLGFQTININSAE